ncbi:MAG: hypothetical protein ABID09_04640 [Candidatus Omnitrophota bacterium]
MNEELAQAQYLFLDKINQICAKFGLNNIMAQLYALLYLSSKPLSLNDMVEQLKISKGSASINMRALERYGAVHKIWVKGSRRDYYEAEGDISKVIMDRVRSMTQHRMLEFKEMIDSSYQALNVINSASEEDQGTMRLFKQRLDELNSLHGKAQSLFNLVNSTLLSNIFKIKPKRNGKKEMALTR